MMARGVSVSSPCKILSNLLISQGAGEQGEAIWRQKNSSYSGFQFGPGDEIGLGSGARIAHCAAALRGIGAPSGFDPRALCSARYAAARRTVAVVGNVLPL